MEAIKNAGNALQYIKEESRTPELLMLAVKIDGESIRFVADNMRTSELSME